MDKNWNLKKLYAQVDSVISRGVGIPQQPQQTNTVPNLVSALDQLAKQNQIPVTNNQNTGLPELPKLG